MYSKSFNTITHVVIGLFTAAFICSGCEKNIDIVKETDKEKAANFIPEKNKKFIYKVENDDGSSGTAKQWLTGSTDSSGIKINNLHTIIEADGRSISLDQKLFALNGKTYTEISVPDAWYQYVEMFGQLPNIKVIKAEVSGYPAFMIMDNALKNGSMVATQTTGDAQAQLIEFTNRGTAGSVLQEITQQPGTAIVETIEVPAGSFPCNKFSYEVNTKITSQSGGKQETSNGNEKVTVWMAHGIGVVKQETTATLVTFLPLPTGEIKKIVTNSSSLTTLQKVE